MELINFRGTLYGKIERQFFVWEPSWDTFRPTSLGWDGSKITYNDTKYKDFFSPYYGFGSAEMKEFCQTLKYSEVPESEIPQSWLTEWWRDRKAEFICSCVSRSPQSWSNYIKYTNSRARTLRKHIHNRATKRLLPK
jgi:hypothetical protein